MIREVDMTHRNWTIEALLAEPSVHPKSPWRVLGPKATGPTQWLTGAYGSLKAIAWGPNAQRVAAGSQKGGTGVWESDTGTPQLLEGHTRPITALAWAKHRLTGRAHVDDPVEPELFSASADGTIAIWSGGEIRGRLRGHQGPVTCIDITHDAGVVVSGSDDKSIRIWDRNAGTLQELLGHKSWVTSVAIHPDGASILSGSADATLVHWQLDDGQGVPWYGHVDAVTSVAFLDDGEHAVSAAKDGTIKVWSVTKGEVITTLRGHEGAVHALSVFGTKMASAGADHRIGVWDLRSVLDQPSPPKSDALQGWLQAHRRPVFAVAWSPDGQRIASAGGDRKAAVWSSDAAQPSYLRHTGSVRACAISADGRRFATGSRDETTWIRNAATNARLARLRGHKGAVQGVAFHPSPNTESDILTVSTDGKARIWSSKDGACSLVIDAHDDPISACAYSTLGHRVFTGSRDGTTRVWNSETGFLVHTLEGHQNWVRCMVTHPDGEHLLTGSYDGTVTTWNIDNAQLVSRFSSHQQASGESAPVTGVGILSDATHAVSGGLDCMLRIWNLHTGVSVKTIEAHSAPIVGLVVVGAVVFSAGRDGTLHAWQMDEDDPTSLQLTDSIAFPAPLDSLAANSAQLVVGDRAGDVWVLHRLPE